MRNKAVPLLILLVLLATALLLIIAFVSSMATASIPSPFLIAATIVSTVALFGAVFSLYIEKRTKSRIQQTSLNRKQ
jgi:hypothetical protein